MGRMTEEEANDLDEEITNSEIRQPPKTPKSRLATETKAEFTLGK